MSELKLNPLVMMQTEPDGTGVLFDPAHQQAMSMNQTAVVLWNAIASGIAQEKLAGELMRVFEVAEDVAQQDVESFIVFLREKQLLDLPKK